VSSPDDVEALRSRLAAREREVDDLRRRVAVAEAERQASASQLTRYATDLNISFMNERRYAEDLQESYRATVRALANAVEARDAYTGHHAERVTAYGIALAEAVGLEATRETEFGFLLHDIGKVAVPDAILFKSSTLTPEEHAVMARHAVTGVEILRDVGFLGDGRLVVRHHHERWDGAGYPDRLRGEDIPPAARVFAVADALDALTTDRPYRPRSTFAAAREEIRSVAGTQFDPAVVAALDSLDDETLLAKQEAAA
jgi:putative nucleotidyltransferase with HDIG domain